MDPISQGVLGTAASQLVANRKEKLEAAGIGFMAALAADLDVVIRSSVDPLMFLEYHRHFTHALVFIPIGALLCAWLYVGLRQTLRRSQASPLSFARVYLFAFAGYATHALLDACTTYGTQLFWPFSNMRVAWNNVSVVDPLFTLVLLVFVILAVSKRSDGWARVAAVYAISYLLLGVAQQNRAEDVARELANARGHSPHELGVKPSFANILVWKSVYQHGGSYYVDAIRVGLSTQVYPGTSTQKLAVMRQFPWLDRHSQQAKDIERFRWFSADHLGVDPQNPNRVIDVRYSLVPNQLEGMWGIELDPQAAANQHVVFNTSRPSGAQLQQETHKLWLMLVGH